MGKDCHCFKRLQETFSGFFLLECKNLPRLRFRLFFCFATSQFANGLQTYESSWVCLQQFHPKAVQHSLNQMQLLEKTTTSFSLQKTSLEKKKLFTQSIPWLLRHVFLLVVCEAWFQILAGESHVADLAAAPGCREAQGSHFLWMSDEWVYDSPGKNSTIYEVRRMYFGL